MMNLMHWRLLVAVADSGNISKAAQRHGISQSGASQALAQLEEALGGQLLTRARRQTTPTALGEQVVGHARAMLASLAAIQDAAGAASGVRRGSIRLAAFPSVFALLLPALLSRFRRLHPGIEVIALEGDDDEVEAWLAADVVDVGVVLNPPPSRRALALGRDAWVALLPVGHALARGGAGVTLEQLAGQAFILSSGGCAVNPRSLVERAGLALTDVRVTVRDVGSAFALVREGMGVALVPESTLPEERRGVRVMALEPPLQRDFGLVCSRAGAASPAVALLLELLRARAASPPTAAVPAAPESP
ncbi:LysR family transcriptional regulator [Janthinobacterium sp.]|uniref:LysR family transcriptional regulator n=1 Tax=Janthinobacterium sp. TaxID=1871054 RepID=UPI00293D64C3|nr:LysR family transcriptional regulator [Janthinobacterium sp.]